MGENTISSSSTSLSTNANHPSRNDNDANDVIHKSITEATSSVSTAPSLKYYNDDADECAGIITTRSTIKKGSHRDTQAIYPRQPNLFRLTVCYFIRPLTLQKLCDFNSEYIN
ncbi:hypothetical protein CLU79DRAFT_735394 [Phycomyces nitens]|nr:hypothetical protein CLU79DRAFT_735394 [Phycomyces nitens]